MGQLTVRDLARCFDGRIPAVIATASASGVTNVTYLSAVHPVDDQRIALSNQFMSKTSRNLAERPQATLLVIDPVSFSEYRLVIRYERTDRRGPVFERLRADVDKVAALSGMHDVFRLRSADVCRVESIEVVRDLDGAVGDGGRRRGALLASAGDLAARMSRSADLETLLTVTLTGLDELLGYRHSSMMMLDESGTRLFTIASHGFPAEGVGSEIAIGDGIAGVAAERCQPVRIGHIRHVQKYLHTVRVAYESDFAIETSTEIPLPELEDAQSRLAVPAMVRGELVGVLVVESPVPLAFEDDDEAVLTLVATIVAQMIDLDRARPTDEEPGPVAVDESPATATSSTHLRFFAEDGSVFMNGDYLIRGVAGRVLWSLVTRHLETGQTEFTNKELRLDRSLELPGFRDNLDTRLVMLKRRLEERDAPLRLVGTGRGRFRLLIDGEVRTELHS
jgi:adenylate cyclase